MEWFVLAMAMLIPSETVLGQNAATTQPIPPELLSPILPEDNISRKTVSLVQLAKANEYPWQAYLLSETRNGEGAPCGGSLIRKNWVLTAAHCIFETINTLVHLGSTDKMMMPYREFALQRIEHDKYNPKTLQNDLALLGLKIAPPLGPNIAVIKLPQSHWENFFRVTSTGFGRTKDGGRSSRYLHAVNLTGDDTENFYCKKKYGKFVVGSMICATWPSQMGESSCFGDSGGPLSEFYKGENNLVGVLSFVPAKGCASGFPTGYTRLTKFIDWIENNTVKDPQPKTKRG